MSGGLSTQQLHWLASLRQQRAIEPSLDSRDLRRGRPDHSSTAPLALASSRSSSASLRRRGRSFLAQGWPSRGRRHCTLVRSGHGPRTPIQAGGYRPAASQAGQMTASNHTQQRLQRFPLPEGGGRVRTSSRRRPLVGRERARLAGRRVEHRAAARGRLLAHVALELLAIADADPVLISGEARFSSSRNRLCSSS